MTGSYETLQVSNCTHSFQMRPLSHTSDNLIFQTFSGPSTGFYQQKDNGDGHWAQTKDGIWKHFAKDGDQSKVDGESFYFKINEVPIYMKVCHTKQATPFAYKGQCLIHACLLRCWPGDTARAAACMSPFTLQ